MKPAFFSLAVLVGIGAAAGGQQGQAPSDRASEKQEQTPQQQAPAKRPTLGPAPAPSLYGPKTSNIVDARRLLRVRKIYVERMDNALSDKLMEAISKTRRFVIVADRKEADAVLRGTCFDQRRLKMLRSEVYLNDLGGVSIWQDSVHRPFNPPSLEAAVGETANLILNHLTESVSEAEHR